MTDTTSFNLAAYEDQESKRLNPIIARRRAFIFAHMKSLGIAEIEIEYNGEGNEGQISEIQAYRYPDGYTPDGSPQDVATRIVFEQEPTLPVDAGDGDVRPNFRELLEDFGWNLLNRHHDGFEINDGGFGTIAINAVTEQVKIEKNDRFTDYTTNEVEA